MAKVIKGNFSTKRKKTPAAAYQLKVSLLYSEPLIWRRVQVPSTMTLSRLHDVIQLSMGWTDSHLHQFMIGNNIYGPADLDDGWSNKKDFDETNIKIPRKVINCNKSGSHASHKLST